MLRFAAGSFSGPLLSSCKRFSSDHLSTTQVDDFVDLQLLGPTIAPSLPALGVLRESYVSEDQKFSRLRQPLLHPPQPSFPHSRRLRPDANVDSETSTEAYFYDGASSVEEPPAKNSEPAAKIANLSLPFDDENFAATLLEAEVSGAIDEAWQDGRRAHLEDVKAIVEILKEMKVLDIAAVDVSHKTSSFDYMIGGTCEGPRHLYLAQWAVGSADEHHRISKMARRKVSKSWEVVPVGRILVNLFVESSRHEYSLERKWVVTRTMDPLSFANPVVSEGRQARVHGLWTLTINLQDLEDFEVDYCKDYLLCQR